MVTPENLAQAILELKVSQEKISSELKASQEQMGLRLEASQEKTDAKMRETQDSLKRLGKLVGNISNNQGDIAEEFFIIHSPTNLH